MSIRLRQAIPGKLNQQSLQSLDTFTLDAKAYIAYTSSSNVVLIDEELELNATLSFWDALPYRQSNSSAPPDVTGVHASNGLVLAWSGGHIVIWNLSRAKRGASWTVHSTVTASSEISCLDLRDGLLVFGTKQGVELWRMDKDRDVTVWERLWQRSYTTPAHITMSPALTHIAWYAQDEQVVHVLGLDRKKAALHAPQELRHPRCIDWIGWRKGISAQGDSCLYTITVNSVLRVYSPVLDDPTWFQLVSSLDHRAFGRPNSHAATKGKDKEQSGDYGTIWVLDAEVLRAGLLDELGAVKDRGEGPSALVKKIMEGLATEEGDVVAHLDGKGHLSLRSIMNLDRKPPTLIKTQPISHVKLDMASAPSTWSPRTKLLRVPSSASLLAVVPGNSALATYDMSFSDLLATQSTGLTYHERRRHDEQTIDVHLTQRVSRFVRTPNGRGLLAIAENGEIGVWSKEQVGKPVRGQPMRKSLAGKGLWSMGTTPIQSAIFAKGRAMVFLTCNEVGTPQISLQHLDHDATTPTKPVVLPDFAPDAADEIAILQAFSDIDDGFSGRGRRTQRAIIMAVSAAGVAWTWRVMSKYAASDPSTDSQDLVDEVPEIRLLSHYRLPVQGERPQLVLPVDPMGWHTSVIDWKTDTPLQDMVLTISSGGLLEFWQPRLGLHMARRESTYGGDGEVSEVGSEKVKHPDAPWVRTGTVNTGKTSILMARCSSRKKTVLVCALPDEKREMTIWDSNVSEFSTGLELTAEYGKDEIVQDLDWTTTSDLQSVLAVGFPHRVDLVWEQRMSYVTATPGWATFITLDLSQYTSVPINDSIWLAGGSLAVGAGNQIYLFSRFLDRDSPLSSPSASIKNVSLDTDEPEDIFQFIASQNGPLVDYHPTVLAQCILWNKMDLVKTILVKLVESLTTAEREHHRRLIFKRFDPFDFVSSKKRILHKTATRKYEGLFDSTPGSPDDEEEFCDSLVRDLVDRLDGPVALPLTEEEKSMLATVAQATLEAERQRRALDYCGLRYLVSIRMVVNHQRRVSSSGTVTPSSTSVSRIDEARLSFRNIVWASHSESDDMLLSAATECCQNGKMLWPDAKNLGVFLWLKSSETIKSQIEIVARNRFMADEDRDPTTCSLIFFALGKKKVVHGLWKQAPGHKEQNAMLKFLANDFTLERWKTAALKNAYALLSKQRYEYAAAFFMLAGQPKDAINVCIRQLDDWQLAVAIARVVEPGSDGPLLREILSSTVIPLAFAGGHRWLATWAFWMIGRRDLAVRVLISPMAEVARAWSSDTALPVGVSENDDPSLLLLFQHLKSKSLQTAKGTSEIPAKMEFDFVLHNARVFFRMGCHALALDLLRSWSFDRPFFPLPKAASLAPTLRREISPSPGRFPFRRESISTKASSPSSSSSPARPSFFSPPGSYSRARRPSFMLANGHGRRESMVMDMDLLAESEAPTRVPSPVGLSTNTRSELGAVYGTSSATNDTVGAINPMTHGEIADKAPVANSNGTMSAPDQNTISETGPRKMGNLMKDLKQDVRQGAMEFDMGAFGF